MSSAETIEHIAKMSDEDVAKGITLSVALSQLAKAPPAKIVEMVTSMVADVRKAERVRLERSTVGARVAADCLREPS